MTTTTATRRKYCHRCETTKPASEFTRDSSKRDGLRTYCKTCINQPPAIVELADAIRLDWASTTTAPCAGKPHILENPDLEHLARKLCRGCPLLNDCREWVLGLPGRDDPGGFRGGLTEAERNAERRRRNPPPKRQPRSRTTPAEKACAKCGDTKAASEFYPQKGRVDGLDNKCLTCRRAEKAEYARQRRAQQKRARQFGIDPALLRKTG